MTNEKIIDIAEKLTYDICNSEYDDKDLTELIKGYTNIDADYHLETDKYSILVTLLPSCDKYAGISCYNKEKNISVSKICESRSQLKMKANNICFTLADLLNIMKTCDIDSNLYTSWLKQ